LRGRYTYMTILHLDASLLDLAVAIDVEGLDDAEGC
jgi:hypothetical protein